MWASGLPAPDSAEARHTHLQPQLPLNMRVLRYTHSVVGVRKPKQ